MKISHAKPHLQSLNLYSQLIERDRSLPVSNFADHCIENVVLLVRAMAAVLLIAVLVRQPEEGATVELYVCTFTCTATLLCMFVYV